MKCDMPLSFAKISKYFISLRLKKSSLLYFRVPYLKSLPMDLKT